MYLCTCNKALREWHSGNLDLTAAFGAYSFMSLITFVGSNGFLYLCNIQFGEVGEPSGPASLFYLNDIFTLYAIDELPLGKKITATLDPGFLSHTFIIYIKEKYSFSQP